MPPAASSPGANWPGPSAGRPAVAGNALPGTTKGIYLYGSIRRTCSISVGCTCVIFFKRRMRFAGLVPSKCRLPECMRSALPLAVNLNRLAAPRCVFSFFFTFCLFLATSSLFCACLRLSRLLRVSKLPRPSWAPEAPSGRWLPCVARAPPRHGRKSPSANVPSSRGRPPGGPSRGPGGRSWP